MSKYNINYIISLSNSKSLGYQSKKGTEGKVKAFVSEIWKVSKEDFHIFLLRMIYVIINERLCLERAFNRIRIKGGMCNPCCVRNVSQAIYDFILENI